MARHQVEQHPHAPAVGPSDETAHVIIAAIPGRDVIIVGDIVAPVAELGTEAGIDPDGVAAQVAYVVQPVRDAVDVAHAVAVVVGEGRRIDLIDHGTPKPGGYLARPRHRDKQAQERRQKTPAHHCSFLSFQSSLTKLPGKVTRKHSPPSLRSIHVSNDRLFSLSSMTRAPFLRWLYSVLPPENLP